MYLSSLLFDTSWGNTSKIGQTVLEILTKMWFLLVNCHHYGKFRIFEKMVAKPILWPTMPCNFMQKIRKIKWTDFEKFAKNPIFCHFGPVLGTFGPKWAEPEFFSKIGLRHFLASTKVHLHAKNQKKLMSGFREKWLHTDARTDGQGWIYRTLTAKSRGSNNISRD